MTSHPFSLAGKKALVVGVANQDSIAHGCAKAFRELGAELALTYLNDKARQFVEPIAQALAAPLLLPLNVTQPGELEEVFQRIQHTWGRLDSLVHSIAFAPRDDLQGRVVDCSAAGFAQAMDISCHSFIRMAKLAEPLMTEGGSLFAMSFHGAPKVVANYNLMGPVKAALEASCRYLAVELGPRKIRVHAISPGPVKTRAASGIKGFDQLLEQATHQAPLGELVNIMDVGYACAYLASQPGRHISGETFYVDSGAHILA